MNALSRYASGCITAPTTIHNWWRSSHGADGMDPPVLDFSHEFTDDATMDATYPDEDTLSGLSEAFQDILNLGCDNNGMEIDMKSPGVDTPHVSTLPFTTSHCVNVLGDAVPPPNALVNIFRSSDMALVARAVVTKSEILAHPFIHSMAFRNSPELTACWSGEDLLDLGLTVILRSEAREWVGTATIIDVGLPALPILVDAPLYTLSPTAISCNPANMFSAFLAYHLQRREVHLCREGNSGTYQPALVKYEDPTLLPVVHVDVPIEVNTAETDSHIIHVLGSVGKEQDQNRLTDMVAAWSPFAAVAGNPNTSAVFAPASPKIRLVVMCNSPATPTPKQRPNARKVDRMGVTGVEGARPKRSDAQKTVISGKRKHKDNDEKGKMKGAEENRANKNIKRIEVDQGDTCEGILSKPFQKHHKGYWDDLHFRPAKDWLPALPSPFREPVPSATMDSLSRLLAQESPSATLRARRKRNALDDDEEKVLMAKRTRRTAERAGDAPMSMAYGSPPPARTPAFLPYKRKAEEADKEDRSKKRTKIPTDSTAHRPVGANLINRGTDARVRLGSNLKLLENRQPFKDILNNVKEKPSLVLGSSHLAPFPQEGAASG